MDTPGFDDPTISDAELLKTITTCLVDIFNDQADIQGALYIHPVTEVRLRGSGRKNLLMFKKMLGMRGMSNCRLVTTKWSLQSAGVSEAREQELGSEKDLWQPLVAAGAQMVRFGDSWQSAIEIINPLVQGPAFKPLLLEEVITFGKTLPQTEAGKVVNDDIEKVKKMHQDEIAELKADEEKARIQRDTEHQAELRAEREYLQAKIDRLKRDKESTVKPLSPFGQFCFWVASICVELAIKKGISEVTGEPPSYISVRGFLPASIHEDQESESGELN
jgi:hypothetical protein